MLRISNLYVLTGESARLWCTRGWCTSRCFDSSTPRLRRLALFWRTCCLYGSGSFRCRPFGYPAVARILSICFTVLRLVAGTVCVEDDKHLFLSVCRPGYKWRRQRRSNNVITAQIECMVAWKRRWRGLVGCAKTSLLPRHYVTLELGHTPHGSVRRMWVTGWVRRIRVCWNRVHLTPHESGASHLCVICQSNVSHVCVICQSNVSHVAG